MEGIGTAVRLSYLTPRELDDNRIDGRMLGLIAFGSRPRRAAADHPFAWVDMPVLDGATLFEAWHSEQPLVRETVQDIRTARNEEVLFGCLEAAPGGAIDAAAYDAYCRIFDVIDSRGYAGLMRVWNYFPGINEADGGLERYRRFSVGRHDAFVAKRRGPGGDTPAACALGSRSGPLVIYFLAARTAGISIENPRQMSAYRYPPQYGPRAPLFSRATLCQPGGKPLLFISGTASIVGHETVHAGCAREQAAETVGNVLAVIEKAQSAGLALGNGTGLQLKAYVRHPEHLPAIRERLTRAFGTGANIVYLQADICRRELLMEVEGVCLAGNTAAN